jgi:hypothetical protein
VGKCIWDRQCPLGKLLAIPRRRGRRRARRGDWGDIEVGAGAWPGATQTAMAVIGVLCGLGIQEIIGSGRVDAYFWLERNAARVVGIR